MELLIIDQMGKEMMLKMSNKSKSESDKSPPVIINRKKRKAVSSKPKVKGGCCFKRRN